MHNRNRLQINSTRVNTCRSEALYRESERELHEYLNINMLSNGLFSHINFFLISLSVYHALSLSLAFIEDIHLIEQWLEGTNIAITQVKYIIM